MKNNKNTCIMLDTLLIFLSINLIAAITGYKDVLVLVTIVLAIRFIGSFIDKNRL